MPKGYYIQLEAGTPEITTLLKLNAAGKKCFRGKTFESRRQLRIATGLAKKGLLDKQGRCFYANEATVDELEGHQLI